MTSQKSRKMEWLRRASLGYALVSFLSLVAGGAVLMPEPLADEPKGDPIVVLGDAIYPPYEYLEDGKPAGANIDLWKAIEEELGRPVEIRLMKRSEAQERVLAGEGHALTFMSRNGEREKLYDFTDPTFSSAYTLFVKADDERKIGGKAFATIRIGVTKGGFPKAFISENHPDAVLIFMNDDWDGISKLLRGEVDAIATSEMVGYHTLRKHGITSIKALPVPFARKAIHISIPKGNPELVKQLNEALQQIKNSGRFDQIIDKWSSKRVVILEWEQILTFAGLVGVFLVILAALIMVMYLLNVRKTARELDWEPSHGETFVHRAKLQKRGLFLVLIMTTVSMIVGGLALGVLYRTALEERSASLMYTAKSQARLIEAVARFDKAQHEMMGKNPMDAAAATISQIVDAREHFEGFGETGEFTLARREGDSIEFILRHRHFDLDKPKPVPFGSKLAEPMRLALSGLSGTVIGLDYRGQTVLAAHEPVAVLDMGIVAKTDLEEIRAPFLKAGGIVGAISIIVIAAGTVLFFRITNPMIRQIQESKYRFERLSELTHEGVIIQDGDKIIDVNTSFCQMFGYRHEELVGQGYLHLLAPESVDQVKEKVAARSEEPYEVTGVRKNGSPFPIEVSGRNVDYQGMNFRVGTVRDITERKLTEEALENSEDRFSKVFHASPAAISIAGIDDGLLHDVNEIWLSILGYSRDEVIGKTVKELGLWTDLNLRSSFIDNLRRDGSVGEFEAMFFTKGGEARAVVLAGELIELNDEPRMLVVFYDITERKRAEEALSESEETIRQILDTVGEGIYGLDMMCNTTFINPTACNILGYSADELIGKSQHVMIHHTKPDGSDYPRKECPICTAFKDGEVHRIANEVFWNKDGTSFPVEYTSTPVLKDDVITGAVVVFRDITERKRAEEALRESEWRYRSVTDSARDAIIAMNSHGDVISWNSGAELIFGYSEKEILGKSLTILIPEKFKEAHKAGLKRIRDTGNKKLIGKTVELIALRKDGSEFPIELTLGSWEGYEEIFFSGIIRDITERMETEGKLRQAQKMDALGNLAGGIAHDLNNLLLPILTLTGMTVKRLPQDSVERERLDKVMLAAEKSRDLVKRILAFSRQKVDIEKANIDFYTSVKDALNLLRSTMPATIKIEEKLNKNVGEIFADSTQIQTVLLNLATNSIDAIEGRIGKLEVSLVRTRVPNKLDGEAQGLKPEFWAKLSVRDTGCGMDKKTLNRVFDPFFTTKGVGEGTGLGLSMVHGIITSHGGAFDVVSSPGKGTTFNIYLPLVITKSQVQG